MNQAKPTKTINTSIQTWKLIENKVNNNNGNLNQEINLCDNNNETDAKMKENVNVLKVKNEIETRKVDNMDNISKSKPATVATTVILIATNCNKIKLESEDRKGNGYIKRINKATTSVVRKENSIKIELDKLLQQFSVCQRKQTLIYFVIDKLINFYNIYQRWCMYRSLQLNGTKMNENFQYFEPFADKLEKCN